ncbi:MAG: nucleotidyltransferase domain-containing protein [Candidatus Omnitrophica bacterium]|nr:nucleotidyltransferase domain-containing protein [Candidatus Omnitrophota bacterium]
MKPEDLAEQLQRALPANLISVILYGSAAAGDFVEKRSDYNVLVVAEALGLTELKAIAQLARAWMKEGNPPPLCFTLKRLERSADVFPMELLDIKENHRVLYGRDVTTQLKVARTNLRHQLEFELKSKWLQLQAGYVQAGNDSKRLAALMVNSLSSFLTFFRGALRLFEQSAPSAKLEAMQALSRHLGQPSEVFERVHDLKSGRASWKQLDIEELFRNYLRQIEVVIDAIDQYPEQGILPNQP